jgi:hypothetical protein
MQSGNNCQSAPAADATCSGSFIWIMFIVLIVVIVFADAFLKASDAFAQPFGKLRQFGAAKQKEQNHHDNQQFLDAQSEKQEKRNHIKISFAGGIVTATLKESQSTLFRNNLPPEGGC